MVTLCSTRATLRKRWNFTKIGGNYVSDLSKICTSPTVSTQSSWERIINLTARSITVIEMFLRNFQSKMNKMAHLMRMKNSDSGKSNFYRPKMLIIEAILRNL